MEHSVSLKQSRTVRALESALARSKALFKLTAQICFLAYPDCREIDFRKSGQQKNHMECNFFSPAALAAHIGLLSHLCSRGL